MQIGIEHAQAAGQVLDDAGDEFALAPQLGFQRVARRDVLEDAHQPHRLAVGALPLADRTHPDRTALCGDQRQLEIEALAAVDATLHRQRHHRARIGGVVVDGLLHVRLVAGLAIVDAAGLVAPDDRLSFQFHRPAADTGNAPGLVQQRLAGAQRGFSLLALGNVHQRAGHPARASVIAAAEQLAAALHPYPVASFVLQPRLVLVDVQRALEVLRQTLGRMAQIVRVHPLRPGLQCRRHQLVQ